MDPVTIEDVVGDPARVSVVRDRVWLACESNPHWVKLAFTPAQARALAEALIAAADAVEGK